MQKTLPETGLVRLDTVLHYVPVSKSTWWQGCRTGRFPKPVKLGRITAWKCEDIRSLIENPEQSAASSSKGDVLCK